MRILGLIRQPDINKLMERGQSEKIIKILSDSRHENLYDMARSALIELGEAAVPDLIARLDHPDQHSRKIVEDILCEIGMSSVEHLLPTLKDPNWEVRLSSARIMGKIRPKSAVKPLVNSLADRHSQVRLMAQRSLTRYASDIVAELTEIFDKQGDQQRIGIVNALGQIGGGLAIDKLIASFKDRSVEVRSSSVDGLKQIGVPAINALVVSLKDEDVETRRYAALSIGGIKESSATSALLDASNDKEWSVRRAVTESLGHHDDVRSLKRLEDILFNDLDEDVRASAATALGNLVGQDSNVVAPLIESLESGSAAVKAASIRGLINVGELAVDPLVSKLKTANADTREDIAGILKSIGADSALIPLISSLKEEDFNVRSAAAEELGKLGDPQGIRPLLVVLDDSNHEVRASVTKALGMIGDSECVDPVIRMLNDPSESVRDSAMVALTQIGKPAVNSLLKVIDSADTKQQDVIISVLGKIKDSRAIGRVMTALEGVEESTRLIAAEALIRFDLLASEPLNKLVERSQGNIEVLLHALHALGEIGSEQSIKVLLRTLGNKNETVRLSAAEALGKIAGSAVEPLINNLRDVFWDVRYAAATALGHTNDERAIEPLNIALKDEERSVRNAAAKSLNQLGYDRKTRKS